MSAQLIGCKGLLGSTSPDSEQDLDGISRVTATPTKTPLPVPAPVATLAPITETTLSLAQAQVQILQVTVIDTNGKGVANQKVNWTVNSGGPAKPVTKSTTSDSKGLASFSFTPVQVTGNVSATQAITASLSTNSLISTLFTVTVKLAVSLQAVSLDTGDQQTGLIGTALVSKLTVTPLDVNQNPAPVLASDIVWKSLAGGGTVVGDKPNPKMPGALFTQVTATATLGKVTPTSIYQSSGTPNGYLNLYQACLARDKTQCVTFTAFANPDVPATVSIKPSSVPKASVGTSYAFKIMLQDRNKNPIPRFSVDDSLTPSSTDQVFSPPGTYSVTPTDNAGVVNLVYTTTQLPSSHTLTITALGGPKNDQQRSASVVIDTSQSTRPATPVALTAAQLGANPTGWLPNCQPLTLKLPTGVTAKACFYRMGPINPTDPTCSTSVDKMSYSPCTLSNGNLTLDPPTAGQVDGTFRIDVSKTQTLAKTSKPALSQTFYVHPSLDACPQKQGSSPTQTDQATQTDQPKPTDAPQYTDASVADLNQTKTYSCPQLPSATVTKVFATAAKYLDTSLKFGPKTSLQAPFVTLDFPAIPSGSGGIFSFSNEVIKTTDQNSVDSVFTLRKNFQMNPVPKSSTGNLILLQRTWSKSNWSPQDRNQAPCQLNAQTDRFWQIPSLSSRSSLSSILYTLYAGGGTNNQTANPRAPIPSAIPSPNLNAKNARMTKPYPCAAVVFNALGRGLCFDSQIFFNPDANPVGFLSGVRYRTGKPGQVNLFSQKVKANSDGTFSEMGDQTKIKTFRAAPYNHLILDN